MAANPKLIAEFGGAYTGPQAAFVERVGRRVAVRSGLSNAGADFTVTTLDSPVENAFAIPGGYIYITRQLLALMNSEAELASVLGHEVGHVAARHAASRNTRSTIASILAAGVGALTGSDLAGRAVGTGAQLYTLKYGREQEYQADALGVRYMAAAGYDPYAAAEILAVARRFDDADGAGGGAVGRFIADMGFDPPQFAQAGGAGGAARGANWPAEGATGAGHRLPPHARRAALRQAGGPDRRAGCRGPAGRHDRQPVRPHGGGGARAASAS